MQVFLFEMVTGGGVPEGPLPRSFVEEGKGMAWGLAEDLARAGHKVSLWCDRRVSLSEQTRQPANIVMEAIAPGEVSESRFLDQARQADVVLVIAPETSGELDRWVRLARTTTAAVWNCSNRVIQLGADKLAFFEWCEQARLPTIPTRQLNEHNLCELLKQGDVVVKPRDGAGSSRMLRIDTFTEWTEMLNRHEPCNEGGKAESEYLVQPYFEGIALSMGVIVDAYGGLTWLPIAEQKIDPQVFTYHGGVIPARLDEDQANEVRELVARAVAMLPREELRGYLGFDLLWSDRRAWLVELNPRLTTSYVGYRRLTEECLGQAFVKKNATIRWKSDGVQFNRDEFWSGWGPA